MIGMSQIKKKWYQGMLVGGIFGVIGIAIMGTFMYLTVKSYQEGTNSNYNNKYTENVAVLVKDVIQGEIITDDMVTFVRVHKSTIPANAITDKVGSAIGKVAKYSIAANVPVTDNMLTTDIISSDVRSQEINSIVMPSDLVEGECVDIRIMFPNGTDYIVLAQKIVNKIENATMWLELSEDERLLLNSAIVDSYLNEGTKLYATKYVDQDAQIKYSEEESDLAQGYVTEQIKLQIEDIKAADETELTSMLFDLVKKYKNYATTVTRTTENYQPNLQVMSLIKTNSVILEDAKAKLSEEARTNIQNGIDSYISENEEKYTNVVTGAQESIQAQQEQRENLVNSTLVVEPDYQ